jgi:hypothetical protein
MSCDVFVFDHPHPCSRRMVAIKRSMLFMAGPHAVFGREMESRQSACGSGQISL